MSSDKDEALKKELRMKTIYKALEDGWTVKKSILSPKTFEFTKGCSDISDSPIDDSKCKNNRRSISAPIVKSKK